MFFDYNLIDAILKALFPLPDRLGVAEESYEYSAFDPSFDELEERIRTIDKEAKIRHGLTKMAIVSPKLKDVIIKIPFNGALINDEWVYFNSAPGSDQTDYCLAEYEKYKSLKTNDLSCFVAKTFLYKQINGVRIFLQEKVIPKCDTCSFFTPSDQILRITDEIYRLKGNVVKDSEWVAECVNCYGPAKVKKFFTYCDSFDPNIVDDFHYENYGYRTNGTPAILDYTDFLENWYE